LGFNNYGSVASSFWDLQTSGLFTSAGGTEKTTAEMKTKSTFTDAGWDFVDIWKIDEGVDYPRLMWEDSPVGGGYSGGSGVPGDPYKIATADDLNDIADHEQDWDKYFTLVNDINFAGYTGTQFYMIGNGSSPFTGVFDGNDNKIWNSKVCLFGTVGEGGEIKNLGMENVDIDSVSSAAGLVQANIQGTIRDCYSNGSVSGQGTIGGLVGQNGSYSLPCREGGGLTFCVFTDAWISNCYSTCRVSGTGNNIGGLVGLNDAEINNCYSTGSCSGYVVDEHRLTSGIGGLSGGNRGDITNSYSTGSVSGNTKVGGLVGGNDYIFMAECDPECFVCRNLLWHYGGAPRSFWDNQTSGEPNSAGGTLKTTAEMKTKSTFTDAGWDFIGETANGTEDIWAICEGTNYPRFVYQIPQGDIVCPDGVNGFDFAVLARYWHETGCAALDDCEGADIDLSGVVDFADVAVLGQNWLSGP